MCRAKTNGILTVVTSNQGVLAILLTKTQEGKSI